MIIRNPIMSPIRFYPYNLVPDWSTYWPTPDNVIPGSKYIEGIYPTKYYGDFITGKTMYIQFRLSTEGTENLTLYKMNATTGVYAVHATITPVDISPVGWVSEKVNRYAYAFTEAGVYYFESTTAGYRSIKFVVHADLKHKKRLVQVQYENSVNDYGMVFYDNGVSKYVGLAYFTGKLMIGTPGNEISAFKTDRGNLIKLQSTPIRIATLTLTEIHYADADRVNMIFSCDTLTINGVTYQNEETGEFELQQGTDLGKISFKLTQTGNEYFTL